MGERMEQVVENFIPDSLRACALDQRKRQRLARNRQMSESVNVERAIVHQAQIRRDLRRIIASIRAVRTRYEDQQGRTRGRHRRTVCRKIRLTNNDLFPCEPSF